MPRPLIDTIGHSRATVVVLLGLAATLAAMGSIKSYLPSQGSWPLIAAPILAAMWLEIRRGGLVKSIFSARDQIPIVVFAVTILVALLTTDAARSTQVFSLVTIAKFAVIWGLLYVLMQTRITASTMELAFIVALIVGVMGYGISALFDVGLSIDGTLRSGWSFAPYGIFWKMGAYAFPFILCRSLREPSVWVLPLLTLSMLVVSLDGSRTGLLALVCIFGVMIALGFFQFGRKNLVFGALLTVGGFLLTYLVLQPMIINLAKGGGAGRTYIGLTILVGAVVVATIEIARHYRQSLSLTRQLRAPTAPINSAPSAVKERVQSAYWRRYLIAFSLLLCAIFAVSFAFQSRNGPEIAELVQTAQSSANSLAIVERFANTDNIRLNMLNAGIDAVQNNFPFGGGLGTTVAEGMHIHFTYLQLPSDIGIIGLIAYLGIFAVFLHWYAGVAPHDKQALVPGLAVLGIFLLQGAFAPLTNELTEWLPVMMAAAAFAYAGAHHRASEGATQQ